MHRIDHLLRAHLQGSLTDPERIELDRWLAEDEENRALFQEVNDPLKISLLLQKLDGYNEQKIWEKIQEKQRTASQRKPVWLLFSRPRSWIKYAAAIVVLGFLSYLYISKSNRQPAQVQVAKVYDVVPGSSKAILTLSNGSTIVLDSATNGELAHQNGTNIVKTGSGSISYLADHDHHAAISYNTLSTPRGGQFQLTLPDGTKVWLNAASSITYPTAFTGKERKVAITGEAYFEVIHNAKQPFRVSVADQLIEDIGTEFNINAYSNEQFVKTTLMEGSARVIAGKHNKVLTPGQQAEVEGAEIKVIPLADISQVVAWKNGLFDFQDIKLEEAMRQLSRWYNIEVVYEKGIPDIEFVGKIKRDLMLGDLLHFLEESGVHFRIENGRRLIVMP